MVVNFKILSQDLKEIANRHKMINSFGIGDLKQLNYYLQLNTNDDLEKEDNEDNKSPKYPLVFVVPQQSNRDRRTITYNFNVIVADILNQDYSNEIDVWSDTLQIAEDILAQFGYGVDDNSGNYYDKYDISTPVSIIPFSESFDDFVSGWNLQLSIVVDSPLDRCIAPFGTFPGGSDHILQETEDNILTEDNNNLEQE